MMPGTAPQCSCYALCRQPAVPPELANRLLLNSSWMMNFPPLITWAALSLILLAIGSATAGLIALIGAGGLGLSILALVFVGNPFSGAASAPELLPAPAGAIGQWLPPGAGANLLRSTAYFGGHGAGVHLTVLVVWIVAGLAAIAVGHHAPVR